MLPLFYAEKVSNSRNKLIIDKIWECQEYRKRYCSKFKGLYWTIVSSKVAKLKWLKNGKNCKSRCKNPYS